MDAQIYLLVSIAALAVIFALVFLAGGGRRRKGFTPFAGLAFAFVVGGIVFGDNRLVGYGLIGVGVVLAVTDMIRRARGRAA